MVYVKNSTALQNQVHGDIEPNNTDEYYLKRLLYLTLFSQR